MTSIFYNESGRSVWTSRFAGFPTLSKRPENTARLFPKNLFTFPNRFSTINA